MKRFLLFGGDICYATGGWNDFLGSFETLEEARLTLIEDKPFPDTYRLNDGNIIQWYQIVDLGSASIVESKREPHQEQP